MKTIRKIEKAIAILGLVIVFIGLFGAITVDENSPVFVSILAICLFMMIFGFIISYIFDDVIRAKAKFVALTTVILARWYSKHIVKISSARECNKFVRCREDPFTDMYNIAYKHYLQERESEELKIENLEDEDK